MLFYRAALDLSPVTRTFVADLITGHHDRIGSRWRALPPAGQALLVHLRCNETFERLAAAFGIGIATAHRYVAEVVALLAELAPDLREAMRIAQRKAFVILNGTLAPIDRLPGVNDRLYFSGKHHRRVNIQFLTDPHGRLLAVLDGFDPLRCATERVGELGAAERRRRCRRRAGRHCDRRGGRG